MGTLWEHQISKNKKSQTMFFNYIKLKIDPYRYHDLPPRVIVSGIHLMIFGANTPNIAQQPI